MGRKLPANILAEIKVTVAKWADAHRYLERTQIENTLFLTKLTQHPDVGGRLQEFMAGHTVRQYIKDAILKKYAKAKRKPPEDISHLAQGLCAKSSHLIETADEGIVSLFRCEDGECVVIARIGYKKWETGLRRCLLYVARNDALRSLARQKLRFGLLILLHGTHVNAADRHVLERALDLISVSYRWVD